MRKPIVSLALAILAVLAVLASLGRASDAVPASVTEDVYTVLPRECGGVNPPDAPVPACCAFGYVFDGSVGAVDGATVTVVNTAGETITATTTSGAYSDAPYFVIDLEAHGVEAGDTITLSAQVSGRQRTLVYEDVVPGGQQVDLVVPLSDRNEAWTTYLTDTFDTVTALSLEGDHLWVGSGGQGAARVDLTSSTSVTYVRPVAAPLYNDVRGLTADGSGGVWWATAGGGAVYLDPSGPNWAQYKVYNSAILGNYLGDVALSAGGVPWFAGWAPAQALVYSVTVDNGGAGYGGVGTTFVEDDWTGSCRGVEGDARWTPSRSIGQTDDFDWVTWTPSLPSSDAYRVYVHFPDFYTEFLGQERQATASARYQVTHDGGTTTVPVEQEGNWCEWILLGEFSLTPGAGHHVYLGDYTGGEDPRRAVLADAVMWERVSDGTQVIVDDGDAGFDMSNPDAWWVETDPWNPDGCRPTGGNTDWMVSQTTGDSAWAIWRPDLPYDGQYEIEAIWPRFYTALPDTSNAQYRVTHAGGTTVSPWMQDTNWCSWNSLGTFSFDPGATNQVYLGNGTGEPDESIILDAVRWTYREGVSHGGTSALTGSTWLTETAPGDSYALAFDEAGVLWAGTATGLARRDSNGAWTAYTTSNSDIPLSQVTALAVDDAAGRVWMGDEEGGGLAIYTPTTGMWGAIAAPFTDVAAVAVDTAGLVWLGSASDGGLAALRPDGSWIVYTAATSNLPGDRVLALLPDPEGGVWIAATAAGPGQQSGVSHLAFGTPPVATIQAIFPSTPVQTEDTILFRAGALDTDEDGDSILRYEWTSDLMTTPLGSTATFTIDARDLPAGQHTIRLRVMDNEGSWSAPVETQLRITPPQSWRFLLYLDGDNNLFPYFERARQALEAADIPPQVTVLALIDGPTSGDTVRYEIQPSGVYQDGANRWHLAEANMGDPQTLRTFINWAEANYPADYTYLAIADHGRGTEGLAWDETSGEDELLTPLEVREALRLATENGATPVDVLHMDACLMGLFEQAVQVTPYADYLIASENLAWSVFPYADYARGVEVATFPDELASQVVISYSARLTGTAGYPHTIAALDLSSVPSVTVAIDSLATALIDSLPGSQGAIGEAWLATQHFDSRDYFTIDANDEYLDLFGLAAQISSTVTDTAVVSAALSVQALEGDLVLTERHLSGPATIGGATHDWQLDGARGVAIYFPPDNTVWGYDLYLNHTFLFTENTAWDEFLLAYLGEATQPPGGAEEPGRPPVPEVEYRVFLPVVVR